MAISGLIVTLSGDAAVETIQSMLASHPRLTLGGTFGRRVALVAETACPREDRELFDELRSAPGVDHVDVAYVHLDEDHAAIELPSQRPTMEESHAHR